MLKHIYEHLRTRKKYNTLLLKYEVKKEELEQKIYELNVQKKINKVEREKFEEALDKFIQNEIKSKKIKIKEKKNENNKCKSK